MSASTILATYKDENVADYEITEDQKYTEIKHDQYIRVAALSHEGLGLSRVKVIFREGGHDNQDGSETAYFMDKEVYRQIELGTIATLTDYKKIAKEDGSTVDEAEDINIYHNK